MSSSQFKITPTPPTTVQLEPGQEGMFSFTVENLAAPDKAFEIMVQALLFGEAGKGHEVDWLVPGPKPTMSISGGETTTITITARPKTTSGRGEKKVKLVIADRDQPNDVYAESSPVFCDVLASSEGKTDRGKKRRPRWLIPVIAVGLVVVGGGALGARWLTTSPVAAASGEPLTGPAPLVVQFRDSSTGDADTVEWSFGDGSPISGERNPSHTYQTPGKYTVALTAKNQRGRHSTAQLVVTAAIPAPPGAVASGEPLSGRVPLTVKFQNKSIGNPSKVAWSFGDGSPISEETNPSHTYQTPGEYTVVLTAKDSFGGATTAPLVVNAQPPSAPVAVASGAPLSGRIPLTVYFQSKSIGDPSKVEWSFGDGSPTSRDSKASHIYQKPGTYPVTLTVSDSFGSSTTAQLVVTAESPPDSGFTSLTLQNGWTHAPFSTDVAAVANVGGIVQLRGAVATAGTNPFPFTLPVGFRPSTTVYVPTDLFVANTGRLQIDPTGVVTLQDEGTGFVNAPRFTSLEGVSFATDAVGFSALTLMNGWTNAPFATRNAAVKNDAGIIRFEGAIATAGSNAVPFILPVGFRPPTAAYVPVGLCNAKKGRLSIQPDGTVTVQVEDGDFAQARCFTSLEGATFALSAAGFTPVTLQNGWVNAPFGTRNLAIRSDNGTVRFQGAVAGGTTTTIFTLPPELRPAKAKYVNVDLCNAKKGRINIVPSGEVFVQAVGAFGDAQCFTSLEGAAFSL